MPLKPDEIVNEIAPKALALADRIKTAFGPASDGGRRLTSKELLILSKEAADLGFTIWKNILD
jgi:hypothetical protein